MAGLKKNNSLENCNKFVTEPGDMIEPVYEGKLLDDGQIELVKVGEKNLQAERDAWKDSCDINLIVQRFQAGEIDVLSQVQGVYDDITEAPKNLAEAFAIARNAENTFLKLPVEIKNLYDNNYMKWLSEAGSESWLKNHGYIKEKNGMAESDFGENTDTNSNEKVGE